MSHFKEEKTFLMIKPDGVQKGLIGEIIKRIEQRDLKIVAIEMFQATPEQVSGHYPKDEVWISRLGDKTLSTYTKYNIDPIKELGTGNNLEIGKMVRAWLIDYMTSAPLVRMVVQGLHAVDMVRKIAGPTLPYLADMGTIRGDFSNDSPILGNIEKRAVMNLVHASETAEEAKHEIEFWFGQKGNIFDYKRFGVDR
ncbi:MAG: nucleoside-diphosphate kinase [Candidatus Zambryskibacteria bacterium RIFCSPLOWO2_01_FULL_39_39]|uniref:nucleoside-diphosphate kinase n=1 Tax=Candidatus Zambryskibacteria bacterium RIFCSPLOWO2_01_FULL_39_39 TaxID=1802758 RepID=A0A1G2TYY3_9BACT|nr:MAG: Nucleoside diphosphate kinase [Parcubacteria group bacterium GW2011_GWA1_38_7]OHA87066.1 MAG: nucleoside-diphosphate kinase [Candidatus Zambryskibacteria bacterium RIFCSPHIGHO2_01_FULL_39_63]OHA94607.1 MAG: nucleoside-diphosphate kinase [Candidatus Zambryskibacteria bacterium RIFCSPHIGHO2_02_FULL_39_19]OHA98058.1 MAG: nucleoside-diphosphate kinase [Candidatus Zambryskibacteria bacterium RIFCSPHIGHO2_12_FULL_39_21]OHB02521.1 MAG: nucleoside-diphosphate kinase [Candidatus Zambryskibacteri